MVFPVETRVPSGSGNFEFCKSKIWHIDFERPILHGCLCVEWMNAKACIPKEDSEPTANSKYTWEDSSLYLREKTIASCCSDYPSLLPRLGRDLMIFWWLALITPQHETNRRLLDLKKRVSLWLETLWHFLPSCAKSVDYSLSSFFQTIVASPHWVSHPERVIKGTWK